MPSKLKPLWRCPKCGERFITRNMWHSCGKPSLKRLFVRCEPHLFRAFKKFARMVRACGPVRIYPQKSRIVCQVRGRFAGATPRKSYLLVSFALTRKLNNPRFVKIEKYAAHWYGHQMRIKSEKELEADLQRWLREAYAVGEQRRLRG